MKRLGPDQFRQVQRVPQEAVKEGIALRPLAYASDDEGGI
jgi:hypothetical protein